MTKSQTEFASKDKACQMWACAFTRRAEVSALRPRLDPGGQRLQAACWNLPIYRERRVKGEDLRYWREISKGIITQIIDQVRLQGDLRGSG